VTNPADQLIEVFQREAPRSSSRTLLLRGEGGKRRWLEAASLGAIPRHQRSGREHSQQVSERRELCATNNPAIGRVSSA
jgi:hypothetical protein